jgi:zinc D-Ala-D-Ala dipeptidase
MSPWLVWMALVLASGPVSTADAGQSAAKPQLVRVKALIPDAVEDLRYATPNNFMGKKVYPDSARCLLLEKSAKMLVQAAEALRKQGFRLRLYDCYRPLSVQWQMWKVFPKPGYVADPKTGSNHNRGGAVDLSLVTREGLDVEMPTPYDTFSSEAHHGFDGGTSLSREHRETLKAAMLAAGFRTNPMEWWHYDIPEPKLHPVLDVPFDAL